MEPLLTCSSFESAALLRGAVESVRDGEMLAISTCRRHELFVLADPPPRLWGSTLLCCQDEAATRLFHIAAGVLSPVPGERAIRSQLERALDDAQRRGQIGPALRDLARQAIEAGDALRRRVEERVRILELADLVAESWLESGRGRLALLGAGALAHSIRGAVAERGGAVTWWGSRRPRAQGPTMEIERVLSELSGGAGDVLVTALAGAPALIDAARLPGVVVYDLGAPRNVVGEAWTIDSLVEACQVLLAPQAEAVRLAAQGLWVRACA